MVIKQKEIVEWLPITLGKDFPGQVLKAKKVYRSGEFEPRTELPAAVDRLLPSVIIDMPQTQAKEYLSKVLSLEHLLPDDILVSKLEQCLDGYR